MFILKYWETALALLVVGLSAWVFHTSVIHHMEKVQNAALEAQEKSLTANCKKAQQITKDVDYEYQNQLTDLNEQLTLAKRVQHNRCITVLGSRPGESHAKKGNAELPNAHGIPADDLLDFAADCEKTGRQLDALQSFTRQVEENR